MRFTNLQQYLKLQQTISIYFIFSSFSPDIPLSGLSISSEHAVVTFKDGVVTMEPAASGSKTKINGIILNGSRELKHHDRILFGSNHMYYFVNPLQSEPIEVGEG